MYLPVQDLAFSTVGGIGGIGGMGFAAAAVPQASSLSQSRSTRTQ